MSKRKIRDETPFDDDEEEIRTYVYWQNFLRFYISLSSNVSHLLCRINTKKPLRPNTRSAKNSTPNHPIRLFRPNSVRQSRIGTSTRAPPVLVKHQQISWSTTWIQAARMKKRTMLPP